MMFRLQTITRTLFLVAALLVSLVFVLQALAPSSYYHSNADEEKPTTTVFIPARPIETETMPTIQCRESLITIEQYRTRTMIRAILVRFPSEKSEYFFVQFRWFYRSWIESEMFTLERWRTDLVVIIDEKFPDRIRTFLTQLNCTEKNRRQNRREISRCILIVHQTLAQRSDENKQIVERKFPIFFRLKFFDDQIDRLLSMFEFLEDFNQTQTNLYNLVMITTMNSFITTQFGKYVPLKCAFLIGAAPDFSSFYGKTDQMISFIRLLISTANVSKDEPPEVFIAYESTIERLKDTYLIVDKQLDIPCDSTKTTYRTSIYQIKCYAHSTSLFSERMFRENSYDGYENQPFNIYIAREYATLMALQSKISSLKDLQLLAMNVTRRDLINV